MRLSRIYFDTDLIIDKSVDLAVATSHYIKHVLRLKSDQSIILFNGKEPVDYLSRIEITNKHVTATPLSSINNNVESPIQTSLFQAIGKSEHIDYIIQKVTELGISEIHLFNSARTQTPLKGSRLDKKINHWRAVVISACEQCGRNIIPSLYFKPTLQASLEDTSNSNKILLDFDGKPIKELKNEFNPILKFSLLVGPEGGLNVDEIEHARKSGFQSFTLGPRVLRMETAALSITNLIQHYYGDMT